MTRSAFSSQNRSSHRIVAILCLRLLAGQAIELTHSFEHDATEAASV